MINRLIIDFEIAHFTDISISLLNKKQIVRRSFREIRSGVSCKECMKMKNTNIAAHDEIIFRCRTMLCRRKKKVNGLFLVL